MKKKITVEIFKNDWLKVKDGKRKKRGLLSENHKFSEETIIWGQWVTAVLKMGVPAYAAPPK